MSGEDTLIKPSSFDRLWISHRGDPENVPSLVVPCCEIFNWKIVHVTSLSVGISHEGQLAEYSGEDFKDAVEQAWNKCLVEQGMPKKRIVKLGIQFKNTQEVLYVI